MSGWNGDMDLIGIGVCFSTSSVLVCSYFLTAQQVFASYYTEAVLVTLFLFAYSFWHIQQHRTKVEPNASLLAPRTLRAFQHSMKGFLDAAQVFSVAMLFAAVYISAQGVALRKENAAKGKYGPVEIPHGSALYDMMLSMLASTFSIFPVLILYTIQRRHATDTLKTTGRPIWFGRIILALMWMLGVMEAFLSLYGNFDYDKRHESSRFAKENCDWRSTTYWTGMRAAQVLFIVGPIVWLLITIFLLTGFGRPGIIDKPFVASWRSHWRLVIAWINLLAMWAILWFFTWVRHKINHAIGHLSESNE